LYEFLIFHLPRYVVTIVTKAWRVLWLRMEENSSIYGGQLQIYLISNYGHLIRGCPPTFGG
jgi:hypothetical protein